MSGAYYNDSDAYVCEWLRNLIRAGAIAPGDVDERSIVDVDPAELDGYTQCHFFAGIGVWSYALRLAGWPDDRPVWTASLPCQPFSTAGDRKGMDDERHLWPSFFRLVRERRPPSILGEQVASPDGLAWLDHVSFDLEQAGYALGAVDLAAASVGAPHKRQRLYWLADDFGKRREIVEAARIHDRGTLGDDALRCGEGVGLDDAEGKRRQEPEDEGATHMREGERTRRLRPTDAIDARGMGDASRKGRRGNSGSNGRAKAADAREGEVARSGSNGPRRSSDDGGRRMDDADGEGSQGLSRNGATCGGRPRAQRPTPETGARGGPWDSKEWVLCDDPGGPRWRPIEPGTFPLVTRPPSFVGRVRAYGNALVAPLAAEFVAAALEALDDYTNNPSKAGDQLRLF